MFLMLGLNVCNSVLTEILAYFNNQTAHRHSSLQQTSLANFLVIMIYFFRHIKLITELSTLCNKCTCKQ